VLIFLASVFAELFTKKKLQNTPETNDATLQQKLAVGFSSFGPEANVMKLLT
jgi:hypothetical protein